MICDLDYLGEAQTYTAQTFSSRCYELWNQSAYHNVPTINGVMQQAGRNFTARQIEYEAFEKQAVFTLDLAGANPEAAQVDSWLRTITLNLGKLSRLPRIIDWPLSLNRSR